MNAQIELLKQRKKELHYTNNDISEVTGIPLQTIEKIFAGITKSPRIDTIQAIESALGISSTSKEISPNSIVIDDEEERDLIMCFRSVTREAKDALISNAHTAVMFYRSDKK